MPRLPFTISLRRGYDTPIHSASSDCEMPRGLMNSSRSISPGRVGGRLEGMRMNLSSVIVDDLDVGRSIVRPSKADAILVVDANAVLAGTIALQALEAVVRGNPQILK